jgi:outer membrane lipoprotein-sorting protein
MGGWCLKAFRFALILGLVLCLTGCKGRTPEDTFIAAQQALVSLESYSATLTYRVMDDEETREYRFNQWVSMPHSFKIILITPDNLAGKIIVSNGKEILIEHSKVEDSIKFNVKSLEQQRPLFIGDFLNSYLLSEEVGKRIHMEEDVEYVILTCPAMDNKALGNSQELWLRAPKMTPVKLINYNADEDISSLILFEEFDRSWKPEENFFDL